jgi:drug/metabolite transporter (DMT)-like permease
VIRQLKLNKNFYWGINVIGLLIGVIPAFLWGLNDVFTNLLSLHIQIEDVYTVVIFALFLAFLQDAFSCAGIMSYHKIQGGFTSKIKQSKVIFWIILIAAICAGPLGMVAGIMGITYAGPVYAGVITACYPVVALVLAIKVLGINPTKLKVFGIILSIIAVMSISIEGLDAGRHPELLLGMGFAVVAMFGWGLESVMFALASEKVSLKPSWILGIRQMFSAISYLIILAVYFAINKNEVLSVVLQMNVWWLVFACVISASFSYLAYYNAIKKIGPSLGTVFNATFVFWAAIISASIGISVLSEFFWVWAILLIMGIFLSTREGKVVYHIRGAPRKKR